MPLLVRRDGVVALLGTYTYSIALFNNLFKVVSIVTCIGPALLDQAGWCFGMPGVIPSRKRQMEDSSQSVNSDGVY